MQFSNGLSVQFRYNSDYLPEDELRDWCKNYKKLIQILLMENNVVIEKLPINPRKAEVITKTMKADEKKVLIHCRRMKPKEEYGKSGKRY